MHASPYSSMEYDGWGFDSDMIYRYGNQQQPQRGKKYPPEAVIARPGEEAPPGDAWDGLSLAEQALTCLHPSIGHYTQLKSLYLNKNQLPRLPTLLFTSLVNLTYLDLSHNQLSHLPPEIECLQHLRHLIIEGNQITALPMEMGRLWRLKQFDWKGNQITFPNSSVMQGEATSIIRYLRDKMDPVPAPAPRPWTLATRETTPTSYNFRVMTYNVLAEVYATEEQHPYTPTHVMRWEARRERLMEEILAADADLICLQEVEGRQFKEFFLPRLRDKGYEGCHKLKTRAKTMSDPGNVDGCAIFYRRSKFRREDLVEVEFASMAIHMNLPTGPALDRTIRRDNIALLLVLSLVSSNTHSKTRSGKPPTRRLMVCNTHIHWDPAEADVKLMQVQFLLKEIERVCQQRNEPHMPLLIAGDFNSEPSNAVFELLKNGRVGQEHGDWNGMDYGPFSAKGCAHPYQLKHSFEGICEPSFSNFNGDFMGILDYIWYSSDSISCIGTAATPSLEEIARQKSPLPNSHYPSDHIYLLAEMELQSLKRGSTHN